MPIYEYQCTSCGHRLEALQGIREEPLTDCPQCREASLTRLISPAGFRLKGGGWYETDFKHGRKKEAAAGQSEGQGKSEGETAARATGSDSGGGSDKGGATGAAKESGSSD